MMWEVHRCTKGSDDVIQHLFYGLTIDVIGSKCFKSQVEAKVPIVIFKEVVTE